MQEEVLRILLCPLLTREIPQVARSEGIVYTSFTVPTPTAAPGLAMVIPAEPDHNGQPLTIHIENKAGNGMYMNHKHDVHSPAALCCPQNGLLPTSTHVTYPTGWAGQIAIGTSDSFLPFSELVPNGP